jgi:hypothetical protein
MKIVFQVVDNSGVNYFVVATDVADAYRKFQTWRVPKGAGSPPAGGIAKSITRAGEFIPEVQA